MTFKEPFATSLSTHATRIINGRPTFTLWGSEKKQNVQSYIKRHFEVCPSKTITSVWFDLKIQFFQFKAFHVCKPHEKKLSIRMFSAVLYTCISFSIYVSRALRCFSVRIFIHWGNILVMKLIDMITMLKLSWGKQCVWTYYLSPRGSLPSWWGALGLMNHKIVRLLIQPVRQFSG